MVLKSILIADGCREHLLFSSKKQQQKPNQSKKPESLVKWLRELT